PEPLEGGPGQFSSLFIAEGNNPTVVDRTLTEMWEQHQEQGMKAYEHVNPGGWTYSGGWSDLIKDKTIINDHATRLRERAALEERVAELEGKVKTSYHHRPGSSSRFIARAQDNPYYTSAGFGLLGGAL